jgi:lipid-A-disaccharide synthase
MIAFLPGSRGYMAKYMVPLFLKVVDDLRGRIQGLRPFFLKSPFISYDDIREGLELGGRIREAETLPGILKERNGNFLIQFSDEQEIGILEGQLERWGAGLDLAVSLPGTNTIQLAYRGIPSLVVAPANKPEVVPVEGAFGMLKWIPVVGKHLMRSIAKFYMRRFPYTALPNLYMQQEIIPELFGILQTADITDRIEKLLTGDEIEEIRRNLRVFRVDSNPVEVIVEELRKNTATGSA